MALKWKTNRWPGHNWYSAEDGAVEIMHFANAVGQPWRVLDNRGVSEETPKPIKYVMSFHRTLGEAKVWAEANDWHLWVTTP